MERKNRKREKKMETKNWESAHIEINLARRAERFGEYGAAVGHWCRAARIHEKRGSMHAAAECRRQADIQQALAE